MRISNQVSYALSLCAAAAILAGCNSGGSQAIPLGSQQRAAPFDTAKIQSTVVTPVAHGTQWVSPDGIVYTPADKLIENSQYNLDLNNDGATDFVITESNTTRPPECTPPHGQKDGYATLAVTGQGSNGFEISNYYVARVSSGSPIGPSQGFAHGFLDMEYASIVWGRAGMYCEGHTTAKGNWFYRDRGYLGLAFVIRGKTHYGWAAIGVPYGYYGWLSAKLKGYAYQTIAGKSIMAGQR